MGGGYRVTEFVESVGRFIVDVPAGTVKTVMRIKDADGCVTESVTHCCTLQVFKRWCSIYRDAEAEIDAYLGRQNVVGMDGLRRHAADTA